MPLCQAKKAATSKSKSSLIFASVFFYFACDIARHVSAHVLFVYVCRDFLHLDYVGTLVNKNKNKKKRSILLVLFFVFFLSDLCVSLSQDAQNALAN